MTTITIELPGKTLRYDLDDNRYIELDESSFTREDAIFDFAEAFAIAEAWVATTNSMAGNRWAVTTGGDASSDDDLEIIFASYSNTGIDFSRWEATSEIPESHSDYGYGLGSFPFTIEWSAPPPTVEEFIEANVPAGILRVAAERYAHKVETVRLQGDDFTDDYSADLVLDTYAAALKDLVIAHTLDYNEDVLPPSGFSDAIHNTITKGD